MDLRERAKTLREGIEGSMGRQVIQLQQLNARADISTATTAANPTGGYRSSSGLLLLLFFFREDNILSVFLFPRDRGHRRHRRRQVPAIHRLVGPPLGA
jgi:hypothetical protein